MGDQSKAVEKYVAAKIETMSGFTYHDQGGKTYGIDGFIELHATPESRNPIGIMMAAQVKSGSQLQKERSGQFLVFRGQRSELEYWLNHSLKVILLFCSGVDSEIYWQVISERTIRRTNKGFVLKVDPDSKLSESTYLNWKAIAGELTPYQVRLGRLLFAKPWMELIASDEGKIVVEVEHWINKSSGRGSLQVFHVNDDGNEEELYAQSHFWPGQSYIDMFHIAFPWAEIGIDEEFYDENYENPEFEAFCYDSDPEAEEIKRSIYADDFAPKQEIYPYDDSSGEIESYRLHLTLNTLGKAFLEVDRYLQKNDPRDNYVP